MRSYLVSYKPMIKPPRILAPRFYQRDTTQVARELLGKQLYHNKNGKLTSGIIIETEAYLGIKDAACHTFQGRRTSRVESMYKLGGHGYVYLIYGMHFCFNVVTRSERHPEAVLIRALQPVDGIEIMEERRKLRSSAKLKDLCSGPGKLCQAMGIDRTSDGLNLQGPELWISENIAYSKIKNEIIIGPRVGIDYAGDAKIWPLRFILQLD